MLKGKVLKISEISPEEKKIMFDLMNEYYDNVKYEIFLNDFNNKDFVIILYADGDIKGFTTQKLMHFEVDGIKINGIFSGDTIIHKAYWGSSELFKVFARYFFQYGKSFDNFYWYLICKGCKTYKMLPTFWKKFYPCCLYETPPFEKKIIDTYAKIIYKDEYNCSNGIIEYKGVKDRLKIGVADIGERERKNCHTAFFADKNPGYINGNDMACLAKIDERELKSSAAKRLFLYD